ncbi:MAG: RluA family pseudouridine synthase [Bacteroidales bacterium]|nr:RluA family pseudouridine synthase [Bacteroidales bacterium]MDY6001580.1 RluA family pseudouridine synthase [Candidatus Cryptobacteroides sp.]
MTYRQIKGNEYDDLSSRILYEDNHLLIFNKKPGEIVQNDKTGDECLAETLKAFIAQRDSKLGNVYLGIPHRLDRPVSGIVVFAKTSKAMDRMSELFRTGAIHKTYWALCIKAPEIDTQELDDWLVRNEKMNKSFIAKNGEKTPGAKLAKLIYRHLGNTDRYALLEVELLTGRHHQIRCQLANIDCIIKGDLKYGAPRSNPDGGISLHSRNIKFEHPVKKELIDITAPVSPSWKGVEKFL